MCVFQIPIFVFAREREMLKHSQFGYKNSPLGEEITHSFPDFVLIKAVLTTQEHKVLSGCFGDSKGVPASLYFVLLSPPMH